MGGDDLGSDDEFLTGPVEEEDEEDSFEFEDQNNKKKDSALKVSTIAVDDDDNEKKRKREDGPEPSSSKARTKPSRERLLLQAGRSMVGESAERQVAFLWTALVHHHRMRSGRAGEEEEDPENSLQDPQPKLETVHVAMATGPSFAHRLRDCLPSMKQLKSWKHTKSPLAIIVCVSARRAVQVMKDLQTFKLRTAKLFAKHISVQEQTQALQQTPFGLAVGTPHRLNVLCQTGALNLNFTRLVILDAHQDGKGFTVSTLPDTAPHCMEFLKDRFLPALRERPKQIKVAFC